jgi:hypothetical protein
MVRAVGFNNKWIIQRHAGVHDRDVNTGPRISLTSVPRFEFWTGDQWAPQRSLAKQFDTEDEASQIAESFAIQTTA